MLFPKDFPEKLRSSILASEVVGKKVRLKARGKEFHGLCPFHNEKTPSFTVNDQKGFYHCFGCQAHGDIIGFVMKNEGLDYRDAVKKLADDFGIPIPQVKIDEVKEDKLTRTYSLLEKTCQFFEKNLYSEKGLEARNYLKKRGLNAAIAKKFRLGFAPDSYEALSDFLKSENFSEIELLGSGVIGQNDRKKIYDKFRNRIIFPITDKRNRPIAFGGRVITAGKADNVPKYLNSAETELFKKSHTLYNIFLARQAIFNKGYAVVVEGYMDAISLFANGAENVVAGLGTALGAEHLKELFYITDKIVICLDGDSAGIRAAKRVSEIALPLINAKKNIAFTILPNQLDPDDFIKEFGLKELEKIFTSATPLSEMLFNFALIDLGVDKTKKISAENKAKIEMILNSKIDAISDNSSKKYFSLFFKDLLFSWGRNSAKNQPQIFNNLQNKIYTKPARSASDSLAEQVIALIVKFPQLAQFRDEDFDIKEVSFGNENLSQIKESIIEAIEEGEENLISALEKLPFDTHITQIKNILARLAAIDLDSALIKLRLLLLKDLLLQVELQYKEALSKIDEIETHQSAVTNSKIREIFDYKNSLEQKILSLEKENI